MSQPAPTRPLRLVFGLALLTLLTLAPTLPAQRVATAEPLEDCQVLARIGRQVILSCEVLWKVNLLIEQHAEEIPPAELEAAREHLLKQQLNGMLDMKLLYADFRSALPEADLAQIQKNLQEPFEEERVPELIKQLDVADRSELKARLRELGASLEDVRQDYFQTMIARSWVNEAVKINREVTHQQMLDYYEENGAKYDFPSQVRWEELMVRFGRFPNRNAAWGAIAEMGNAAYTAASTMPDPSTPAFDKIAKAKSHGYTADKGGEHDWTTKGALAAARVDEALFTLPVGQMSPILKSEQGFHIVRVLERKLAGRKPFTEVQSEIENRVQGQRFDAALKIKLEDLRRNTQIWTVFSGTTTAQAYLDSQRQGAVRR